MSNYKIFDPLYGQINLEDFEYDFLNIPEIQRLRLIKQTGMAYVKYPGANHTIFEHIIGTLFLAKKYLNTYRLKENKSKLAKILILLREVGSEPLRHVLWDVENRFPKKEKHDRLSNTNVIKTSESISKLLEKNDINVSDVITRLSEKLGQKYFYYYFIEGPLSFNRLDYYHRDSFYAGIKGIDFNLDEIFDNSTILNGKAAYSENALSSIEHVLLSRIYLYYKIYSNPEIIKSQKILSRIIEYLYWGNYKEYYEFKNILSITPISDDELIYTLRDKLQDKYNDAFILIENSKSFKTLNNIYRWQYLSDENKKTITTYLNNPIKWKNDEKSLNDDLGLEFGTIIVDFENPTIKPEIKKIHFIKQDKLYNIDKVSPLIGPLNNEKNYYDIVNSEKRNWYLGIYYNEKILSQGINETEIKKNIEKIFNLNIKM